MADNKLAPPPRNALARRSDPLQTLLRETEAAGPQYSELVGYLTARRMMPPISIGDVASPTAVAEFVTPGFYRSDIPQTGVVRIGRAEPNSVAHELTHAAQRQMGRQYFELEKKRRSEKLNPQEQQFMAAYEKLIYTPNEIFGRRPEDTQAQTARRIAPDWAGKEAGYRASGRELSAFGVGNMLSQDSLAYNWRAPTHIDPTYATEFSILLDLARRAQPVIPGR